MNAVASLATKFKSFAKFGPQSHRKMAKAGDRQRLAHLLNEFVIPSILALALVGVVTFALIAARTAVPVDLIPLAYLIPVVMAATRWGVAAAFVAAVASAGVIDFFFYPPFYTFIIYDPQQIMELLVFLFVGFVTGNLAALLRREANALRQREAELHDLYRFSRRLTSCFTVPDLVFAIQDYLANALGRRAVLIGPAGEPSANAVPPAVCRLANAMVAARQGASPASSASQSRTIVDETTQRAWLISLMSTRGTVYGAIAVELGIGSRSAINAVNCRVEVLLAEVAATLERLDLEKALREAELRAQADRLTQALVGAVSHDLRTPLASIMGSASVLRNSSAVHGDDRVNALVESMHDEAERLDHDIQALLDATLITRRGVRPRLEWTDPVDIVDAAIKQRGRRLAAHRVSVDMDPDLPMIRVDSALIEQALAQILENAAKYSVTGSEVKIVGRRECVGIVLSVQDSGAGLTPDEATQLYQRAFRGERHVASITGSGLGLWIARAFVTANRGTIHAASLGPGLGTTVSIRLPLEGAERAERAVPAPAGEFVQEQAGP